MRAERATKIEEDYDVLSVDLERGFYGFYEPNSKTCAISYDGLEHTDELIRLNKRTAGMLIKSLRAMCELMGWEES